VHAPPGTVFDTCGGRERRDHVPGDVALSPGEYAVRVEVNGSAPAAFDFTPPEKGGQGME